ncbi:DJ-1/PfpI family protein [Nevskia sp.]|uniref:DJ-1/PfpI family protein n=1 Tax=Nevskia sp. TaxID=1929292 RepID=UPI003F6F3282
MSIDRRTLLGISAAGLAGVALTDALARAAEAIGKNKPSLEDAQRQGAQAHEALMAVPGMQMHGSEQVAMLLYPGFTALDLIGPHFFLASMMGATVHLVAAQREPVVSDVGVAMLPNARFDEVPEKLDVLLVPGGAEGTVAAARDAATLAFVKSRGANARYVASVCTGAVILGAAGLLAGRRATTHWGVREALADFGAKPVDQRVVLDGRLVTGAGVSAGLDLGLALIGLLRGKPFAEAVQLMAEYAPVPPYHAGTPGGAPRAIEQSVRGMFAPLLVETRALAAGS